MYIIMYSSYKWCLFNYHIQTFHHLCSASKELERRPSELSFISSSPMPLVTKSKPSLCGTNSGKHKRVIHLVNHYFIFWTHGLSKYRVNINLYNYLFYKTSWHVKQSTVVKSGQMVLKTETDTKLTNYMYTNLQNSTEILSQLLHIHYLLSGSFSIFWWIPWIFSSQSS